MIPLLAHHEVAVEASGLVLAGGWTLLATAWWRLRSALSRAPRAPSSAVERDR